jgi:hypothetical protein
MTINQNITAYAGTVPDKDSQTPAEFNSAADAFVAWMGDLPAEVNAWAGEANSLATTVNGYKTDAESAKTDAESARNTAMSAANFVGNWADQVGAATVPTCVYHNGQYWMLLVDLADITTSEPTSASTDWAAVVYGVVWERKTAAFTAESWHRYTVAAGITVTLPLSPSAGDQVWFAPLGDMTASAATIARNGNLIMGLAEDMTWDMNAGFSLVYDSTNGDWRFA